MVNSQSKEVFSRLAHALPASKELGRIEDPDDQARGALSFMVERIAGHKLTGSPPHPIDPSTCPNCGTPVESTRSPYCGDACREMSAFIRQFRTYVSVAISPPLAAMVRAPEEEGAGGGGSGNPGNRETLEAQNSSVAPQSKIQNPKSEIPEGPLFVRERQIAMGEALWHVLGGGRPRRQHMALARTRATVLKREEGKCQICGAPATTFDHIGSG